MRGANEILIDVIMGVPYTIGTTQDIYTIVLSDHGVDVVKNSYGLIATFTTSSVGMAGARVLIQSILDEAKFVE